MEALSHAEEPGGEEKLERAVRRLVGYEVRAGIVPPTPRGTKGKHREETPSLTPRSFYFDEATPRMESRGRGEWDPTPLPHEDVNLTEGSEYANADDEHERDADRAPPLDGLTLSSFQAQYTSEDNASFLDILKANEAKRKHAFKWAYDAEQKANDKRQRSLMASQLQAQAGFQASLEKAPLEVKKRIEAGQHPKLITSNGEAGTVQSKHIAEQLPSLGTAEISPALEEARSLQSWSHTARNPLFFGPDASRNTYSQRTSSLPLSKKATSQMPGSIFGDEVMQDRAPSINFRNTRLVEDDEEEGEGDRGSETPRSSRIDAAIGGWGERASSVGGSSQSAVESSPRVAGYSFVSPLPSPRPGDLGEERVRQLMTKGIIVGTPRAVRTEEEEEDQYDGSFRIPPTPNRDLLARRLTDKTTTANRKRSSALCTPRSSSKRSNRVDLSPAGRNLLDRSSRGSAMTSLGRSLLASKSRDDVLGSRLKRERWTPSPSPAR